MIVVKDQATINAISDIATLLGKLNVSLSKVGQLINASIKERSKKGIGLNGRMPSYTPAYKKWKKKKGRKVSTRDLTFSGKMWASLTEKPVGEDGVRLLFGSKAEQAKALGNTEVAPFFGMTEKENKIFTKFKNDIMKSIKL